MFKKFTKITVALGLAVGLTACGSSEESNEAEVSIGESLEYKIVGIDPGAGLMNLTINEVIPEYGLDEWEVIESSGAAMTAALDKAYKEEEPIIVTGWTPHWKFSNYDLKYLEDPKGLYGGAEDINTIVRQGLSDDHPNAYKFFDQFNWKPEDLQSVMNTIVAGAEPLEAAEQFVNDNEELVNSWIEGTESVDGDELSMTYVAWADVIASSNVVKYALEEKLGYDVTLVQVDAGPMWAGVADGSADAMVGAWLPTTHADYYAEYEGDVDDLGPNLQGTKQGLVVPTYMDIDSIEDLKGK